MVKVNILKQLLLRTFNYHLSTNRELCIVTAGNFSISMVRRVLKYFLKMVFDKPMKDQLQNYHIVKSGIK